MSTCLILKKANNNCVNLRMKGKEGGNRNASKTVSVVFFGISPLKRKKTSFFMNGFLIFEIYIQVQKFTGTFSPENDVFPFLIRLTFHEKGVLLSQVKITVLYFNIKVHVIGVKSFGFPNNKKISVALEHDFCRTRKNKIRRFFKGKDYTFTFKLTLECFFPVRVEISISRESFHPVFCFESLVCILKDSLTNHGGRTFTLF